MTSQGDLLPESGTASACKSPYRTGPALVDIGKTNAVCPYCSSRFGKMPTRKLRCARCQRVVVIRTRPSDGRKVLLREEDIERLEQQWLIATETEDYYFRQRERWLSVREVLHRRFGRPPG